MARRRLRPTLLPLHRPHALPRQPKTRRRSHDSRRSILPTRQLSPHALHARQRTVSNPHRRARMGTHESGRLQMERSQPGHSRILRSKTQPHRTRRASSSGGDEALRRRVRALRLHSWPRPHRHAATFRRAVNKSRRRHLRLSHAGPPPQHQLRAHHPSLHGNRRAQYQQLFAIWDELPARSLLDPQRVQQLAAPSRSASPRTASAF